jgi:xanthine dehydrogenase molybdopterin-binding subunit B
MIFLNCELISIIDELHLYLVLSSKARAKIVSIDWSDAKRSPGVVDCIDHTAIPESNKWGFLGFDEEVFASSEVCQLVIHTHPHHPPPYIL